jgi:hypothetical protein
MSTRTISVRLELEVDTETGTTEAQVLKLVATRLERQAREVAEADPRVLRIIHVGTVVRKQR